MNATTTIRVSTKTYEELKELAQLENVNMTKIVEQAVHRLKKEKFFHDLKIAYSKLQNDPAKWKEEIEEREAWDTTLNDGLD